MNPYFIPNAFAATEETTSHTEVQAETEKHEESGLSIQPTTVAFQALNFIVLLVILKMILYKPLMKLMQEREQRIKEGVENADKAKLSLAEATNMRSEMMKRTNVESQQLMELARKASEELKANLVKQAQDEAGSIIQSGHKLVEMEKAKTLQELKGKAVNIVIKATEKMLREKIDPLKDAKLLEESLNSYSV